MNKTFAFASHIRHHAVLCATAAALVTAFGAGNAVAATSATSPTLEAATTAQTEQIRQLYLDLLGREPDAAGLAWWAQALDNGVTMEFIAAQLKASEEYAKRTNTGSTATGGMPTIPATTYNYYVSPTGSDTAAGTKTAPFKTLARAAKAAIKPSTTVWVAPGTYAGGIKTTGNGSATGRIYWVSTTKWGAKIVPPASSTNKTAWTTAATT